METYPKKQSYSFTRIERLINHALPTKRYFFTFLLYNIYGKTNIYMHIDDTNKADR